MSKIKLSDITSVITKGTTPMTIGFNFQDEGINFVKVESITGYGTFILNKLEHISNECNNKLRRSILFENDILFSIAGALGRTAIVTKEILPANTNQALAIIRLLNINTFSKYIQYALKSGCVYNQFQKKKQGVAQLNLSLKNIGDLEVPLPPLETQKQIAKTLDTAAELLAMRKQQLAELDNLIKSTFYDMFGDPVANDKGWQTVTVGDLITILTDYHANGSYEKLRDNVEILNESNYALMIRTTDLENENYLDDVKYITKEAYEYLEKSKVFGGEIIINKIGSAGKVYLMPYLNRPVSLAMNQFLLRFNDDTNILYVYYYLTTEFSEKNILDRVRGAVTKTITKDAVRSIPFRLPPLSVQTQFAEIVTKIEEQKALVKKAIDETQYLFDSLMSEYFE